MQDLNPLPFAATILNCSGWVVYTVLVRNWFVFCTDAPGLLCSIWMTFSLYPHASLRVSTQRALGIVYLLHTNIALVLVHSSLPLLGTCSMRRHIVAL